MAEQPAELRGHEATDLPLKPFLAVVFGLFGSALIICFAMFCLMRGLAGMGSMFGRIYRPTAAQLEHFPKPEIQVDPDGDLRTYLAREEKEINSYGWIDRDRGIVHLPIRKAMELMLARHAPVRSADQGPTEVEWQQQKSPQRAEPNILPPTPAEPKEKP
jgi:hypothetical protein